MKEKQGNIWKQNSQFVCVTTNGVVKHNGELVMGAGIALEAKQKFPELPKRLGTLVHTFGNLPFYLEDIGIISFPTKNHFKENSDIKLIERSAKEIAAFVIIRNDLKSIALPRPGCGNGRLNWQDVKKVLEPILKSDIFTVYYE